MKPLIMAALLGLPLSFITANSHAVQVMTWERVPLAVPLIVNQERVVFVDRNVRVGAPTSLGNRLRIQSAAGAVYLRANAPIEPTRLQLMDAITGELILVDIAAENAQTGQPHLEDIRIIEPPNRNQRSQSGHGASPPRDEDRARHTPVAVLLTRYAAQNLYAPLRTVEPLPGVRRVNVAADLPLDLLLPSLPVEAKALAAWRLEHHWATAIRLINQTQVAIDLDPRKLLGNFTTATFQHQNLGPKGTPTDTTVVYLITRGHGIRQALLPSISPVDAAINISSAAPTTHPEVHHEE